VTWRAALCLDRSCPQGSAINFDLPPIDAQTPPRLLCRAAAVAAANHPADAGEIKS
jgi:hypothetical protein